MALLHAVKSLRGNGVWFLQLCGEVKGQQICNNLWESVSQGWDAEATAALTHVCVSEAYYCRLEVRLFFPASTASTSIWGDLARQADPTPGHRASEMVSARFGSRQPPLWPHGRSQSQGEPIEPSARPGRPLGLLGRSPRCRWDETLALR